jgi:hypothetical protein
VSYQIQLREGTAAAWTSANTVLAQGEEGHETDTGKRKVGDGVTAWNSLPYWPSPSMVGAAPLASPAFTGTPTAPTQTSGDSSTRLATTAFTVTAAAGAVATAETYAAGVAATAQAAAIAASLPTLAQASVSTSGALALDTITEVTAATALTMTLPSPVTGSLVVVERASASTANVAVTGSIRGGVATITLQLASESEAFFATAGSWWPIAGHKTLGSLDARYQLLSSYAAAGDLLYGTGAGTSGKLAGNASAVQMLLAQTGTGAASAAPVWMYPAAQTLPQPTGVAATDTAAIHNAENALNAFGGGALLFQPGTYVVNGLTKQSAVTWQGAGRYATIIQLANGANTDVVQGANFSTLTLSGSITGGIGGWGIRDLTIDGNKANQSGTSYCLRVYGYEFDLTNVSLRNGLTDGLYTEWGNYGGDSTPDHSMEAHYRFLKIHGCGGNGWHNRGPHDSRVYDVTMFENSTSGYGYWAEAQGNVGYSVAAGSNGVNVSTFAGAGTLNVNTTLAWPAASVSAAQGSLTVVTSGGTAVITYTGKTATSFTGCTTVSGSGTLSTGGGVTPTGGGYSGNGCLLQNVHVFGQPLYDYLLDAETHLIDCIGEVASAGGATVLFRCAFSAITGGYYFIVPGAPVVGAGLQIGDTVNSAGSLRIETQMSGFSGADAAHAALNIVNDGGGSLIDVINYQSSGQAVFGSPQFSTRMQVNSAGQAAAVNAGNGFLSSQAQVTRFLPSISQGWRLSQAGANDLLNMNVSSNRLEHNGGLLDRWYSGNYSTVTAFIDGSTGQMAPTYLAPAGLTGATAASRYVGATSSGAPVSGAFAAGDFIIDRTGLKWVCTAAGTPGTWASDLLLTVTASDIQPAGIRALGNSAKAAAANHVHQNSDLSLYLAPSGATSETLPRSVASVNFSGLASQQVYVSAIPLPAGLAVNNITMMVGSAAFTGVTHGWYALLDSGLVVRAVSADQASGNWGSIFTAVSLSVAASGYTTSYSGLYYVAVCITFTGSGQFSAAPASAGGVTGLAPVLSGTSSSGQTTPPATGATLGAVGNVAADRFYAYTS